MTVLAGIDRKSYVRLRQFTVKNPASPRKVLTISSGVGLR